jgi:hypothetical protein
VPQVLCKATTTISHLRGETLHKSFPRRYSGCKPAAEVKIITIDIFEFDESEFKNDLDRFEKLS